MSGPRPKPRTNSERPSKATSRLGPNSLMTPGIAAAYALDENATQKAERPI